MNWSIGRKCLSALLLFSLAGCLQTETILVNNVRREFTVFVPDNVAEPAKLTFFFHGMGGDLKKAKPLYDEAEEHNYVVVALLGMEDVEHYFIGDHKPIPGWSLSKEHDNVLHPDLVAFDVILTEVRRRVDIDPAHIHAVGMSNGGFLLNMFAGYRGETLASVAVVEAGMAVNETFFVDPVNRFASWYPTPVVKFPVYLIGGALDPLVPPPAIEATIARYQEKGYAITSHIIKGMTHGWPNGKNNPEGFDAAAKAFEFFDTTSKGASHVYVAG